MQVTTVEILDLGGVLREDRLALELHRQRDLVTAGLPQRRQYAEAFDLFHPRQFRVARGDTGGDAGDNLRVGRQGRGRGVGQAVPGRKRADGVGVEDHERGVVRPPVADRDHHADHVARGQDGVFNVGRRHVLSGRVDDQLLLTVDHPQIALARRPRRCRRCATSRRRRSPLRSWPVPCGSPSSPAGREPGTRRRRRSLPSSPGSSLPTVPRRASRG